jgi:hypothetical protein
MFLRLVANRFVLFRIEGRRPASSMPMEARSGTYRDRSPEMAQRAGSD